MFIAVAIPKMAYAADVWYTPIYQLDSKERRSGSVRVTRRLASIQRLATTAVTGTLRSTATDMLDLHANVFPADLSLQQVCDRAAVRLATLPPEHPLANLYRQRTRWFIKSHRSPLHDLAFIFSISPSSIEKMPPARTPPRRQAKFRVAPPRTAEESIEWDLRNTAQTRIYTDGLGFDGLAGAAAVLFRGQAAPRVLRYQLGPLTEHTTFEAEALGVILGLHLLGSERQVTSITISTDSQAVLGALDTCKPKPGQQYIDEILRLAIGAWCRSVPGDYSLELAWVKGHDGSKGNKRADLEVAGGSSSPVEELPNFLSKGSPPTSASALWQVVLPQLRLVAS